MHTVKDRGEGIILKFIDESFENFKNMIESREEWQNLIMERSYEVTYVSRSRNAKAGYGV